MERKSRERRGFWEGVERGDLCGRVENGMQGKSEERVLVGKSGEGGRMEGEEWRKEGILGRSGERGLVGKSSERDAGKSEEREMEKGRVENGLKGKSRERR